MKDDHFMKNPDRTSLFWLFGCEPEILDKHVPIIYNLLTYSYDNSYDERMVFSIYPAGNEVRIQVSQIQTSDLIVKIELNHVSLFEILKDEKMASQIKMINKDHVFIVNLKPKFKIFISDNT